MDRGIEVKFGIAAVLIPAQEVVVLTGRLILEADGLAVLDLEAGEAVDGVSVFILQGDVPGGAVVNDLLVDANGTGGGSGGGDRGVIAAADLVGVDVTGAAAGHSVAAAVEGEGVSAGIGIQTAVGGVVQGIAVVHAGDCAAGGGAELPLAVLQVRSRAGDAHDLVAVSAGAEDGLAQVGVSGGALIVAGVVDVAVVHNQIHLAAHLDTDEVILRGIINGADFLPLLVGGDSLGVGHGELQILRFHGAGNAFRGEAVAGKSFNGRIVVLAFRNVGHIVLTDLTAVVGKDVVHGELMHRGFLHGLLVELHVSAVGGGSAELLLSTIVGGNIQISVVRSTAVEVVGFRAVVIQVGTVVGPEPAGGKRRKPVHVALVQAHVLVGTEIQEGPAAGGAAVGVPEHGFHRGRGHRNGVAADGHSNGGQSTVARGVECGAAGGKTVNHDHILFAGGKRGNLLVDDGVACLGGLHRDQLVESDAGIRSLRSSEVSIGIVSEVVVVVGTPVFVHQAGGRGPGPSAIAGAAGGVEHHIAAAVIAQVSHRGIAEGEAIRGIAAAGKIIIGQVRAGQAELIAVLIAGSRDVYRAGRSAGAIVGVAHDGDAGAGEGIADEVGLAGKGLGDLHVVGLGGHGLGLIGTRAPGAVGNSGTGGVLSAAAIRRNRRGPGGRAAGSGLLIKLNILLGGGITGKSERIATIIPLELSRGVSMIANHRVIAGERDIP